MLRVLALLGVVLYSATGSVLRKRSFSDFEFMFEAAVAEDVMEGSEKRSVLDDTTARPGSPTRTNSCQNVRAVPDQLRKDMRLGLPDYYQQYTEAYGIPILASSKVKTEALRRACYVVRFMLADHSKIREMVYKLSGRFAIIAKDELPNRVPEHRIYDDSINSRLRGIGAEIDTPASSSGEENLLCYKKGEDTYYEEDYFVHEVAHAVHLIGARYVIPGFDKRLKQLYDNRKRDGVLWKNTYAMTNHRELYAEVTQSFFGVNTYRLPSDGIHNNINGRGSLERYDPEMYKLLLETFPCKNDIVDRCKKDRTAENRHAPAMNCDGALVGVCKDIDNTKQCPFWAGNGDCKSNFDWMSVNCPFACDVCTCTDSLPDCGKWYGWGECRKNKSWMSSRCKKSCGTCDCWDADDRCDDWAADGQCEKNPSAMSKKCKLSCNTCDCWDEKEDCYQKAARGECETNPRWMAVNCRKSCKKCHCSDSAPDCAARAARGECTSKASWMSGYCKLSCNTCDCYDDESECKKWAGWGECGVNQWNSAYMSIFCRKSCNTCSCQDYDTNCSNFRARGECDKNPDWMNLNCPRSCGKC